MNGQTLIGFVWCILYGQKESERTCRFFVCNMIVILSAFLHGTRISGNWSFPADMVCRVQTLMSGRSHFHQPAKHSPKQNPDEERAG